MSHYRVRANGCSPESFQPSDEVQCSHPISKQALAFKLKRSFSSARATPSPSSTLQNHCQQPISLCTSELTGHGFRILADHPNPEISLFPQKGFSEISSSITGKAVHALSFRRGLKLGLFQSNTLISMYSKYGISDAALQVFVHMPQRNDASWNAAISACVRRSLFSEAVELFRGMRGEGMKPNGFVLASLLTACNRSAEMVGQGVQIHAFVIKTGQMGNVYVGTALLHLYGSHWSASDAQRLFHEMPERNVVSWTALMVSCSSNGDLEKAVRVYHQMRSEGVTCNPNCFATVISSCSLLESEHLGLQVLGHVIVSGCEADVSVGNSLITMFGSFDKMDYAEYIFHRLEERDRISWNSMISMHSRTGRFEESLKYFSQMRNLNIRPDCTTLSSLISACGCVDYLRWGMAHHAFAVKVGLDLLATLSNTLVNMYSMCGRHDDAELLFYEMPERDLISWNSMIASYVRSGQYLDALKLLAHLLQGNKEANHVTFANALTACTSPEALLDGKAVHAFIVQNGLQENLLLCNSLITMYGKCNAMEEAKWVFQTLTYPNLVAWNALIGGYIENGEQQKAVQIYACMRQTGTRENYITILNMFGACSAPDDLLKLGMPLHGHVVSAGFESDGFIKNSLLSMYAKCGDFASCEFIFEKLGNKNAVSWNAMIASKAQHGYGEEALKFFVQLRNASLELDQFSLSGALMASAILASLEEGQQLHNLIIKLGFHSDLHVINAAMDMYGKCGKMDDVLKLLPETQNRLRQSWNVLMSGYARHGCYKESEETFQQMLQKGPKPDYVTFVSLLSACNHAGLVGKGLKYYSLMTSEFGISPGIEHCVCMVDLLGRSGRLVEAGKFVEEMPVPPNDFIWRSLLASCRIHGNLEMGRKAAERLLELDPLDDSAYVLLSNVCAVNRMWEVVDQVRTHMKSIKVTKSPACSWIKIKNKVSSFGIGGDRAHPQAKQIQAKLEEILQVVKGVGYSADTTFSLHDTDEEQKEHNLWNHGEKLALAFGLMYAPEGSDIRVFKNLRVCGDCHLVYKLVSSVIDREIVLRDPYRFHHFRGGNCSCSDYW